MVTARTLSMNFPKSSRYDALRFEFGSCFLLPPDRVHIRNRK